MPWDDFEKELIETESAELRLEAPEDLWMKMSDYREKYGDPTTNGKGHMLFSMKGQEGVLLPGERVWKYGERR